MMSYRMQRAILGVSAVMFGSGMVLALGIPGAMIVFGACGVAFALFN
jgi:hypothetical protein